MEAPLLSIGIPTFNRLCWLQACVAACLPQVEALAPGTAEIVVSDNAGSDGSWAWLQAQAAEHPCLRVHRNPFDCGAENFNVVTQEARGRYVWLMGDDDAPLPGGVARVVALLREAPRDLYLLHSQEVDPQGRPLVQRAWFQHLPSLDWDLSRRADLITYLDHAQYMAGAFGFISVLVFDRLAWIEQGSYPWDFGDFGWPHVVRVFRMLRTRGRVRVVEEALLQNTAGNDGREERDPWGRAMWDLEGWVAMAQALFPDDPELFRAFLGPLRRNRQAYLIRNLSHHAPGPEAWAEARRLMAVAGIPAVAIAAHQFGMQLQRPEAQPPLQLDPEALCLADLGFIARGARRVLVLASRSAGPDLGRLLAALLAQTRAQIRVLGSQGSAALDLADGDRVHGQAVDLVRVAGEPAHQAAVAASLQAFAPDLVLNADPERRPSWDLLVASAGAVAALAFQAPPRAVPAELSAWLDSGYTRLVPAGPLDALCTVLGLDPDSRLAAADPATRPAAVVPSAPVRPPISPSSEGTAAPGPTTVLPTDLSHKLSDDLSSNSDPSSACVPPSASVPPSVSVPSPASAPPSAVVPAGPAGALRLNLGCGRDHLAGWVNVDQFPGSHPDVVHDLERFPWPFPDDCAGEVLLKHVLEHLGRDSATFLGIMGELYRVCAPGARVRILVPHPRHRDFLQDPTHVRPVLAEMFEHFSLDCNEDWGRRGLPGTPLALYLGLDFRIESATLHLDPWWDAEFRSGRITREQLERAARDCNNVVATTEVVLRARKPFRGSAPAAPPVAEAAPGPSPRPTPAARPAVIWEGSQFVHHSLAHVNRQLCLGLLRGGQVDLSLVPYEPDQFDGAADPAFRPLAACVGRALPGPVAVQVRHQWPPQFQPPAQGAWVMIQPWEFGGIPAEWIAPMRDQVDEIWVPSAWLKDCYVRSGIPAAQVVVVPNGVDGQVFRPDGARFPLATRRTCRFLFLGGTIHRKGFDLLLETYVRTFRAGEDVCLVIKEQGGGVYGTPGLPAQLARLRAEDPQAPEIEYRTDDLSEAELASLYRACDVLVLPYRGEGFGLPIAEAMASGLPVLVTGRGGAQDFARAPWAYLLPSTPVGIPSPGPFTPGPAGFWMEEPDAEALAGFLRRAYADPEERRRMGALGRAQALAELGWDRPVALVQARLGELAGRTPRRFTPPAPVPEPREAFLYAPDWSRAEWMEVLLSFMLAFQAGDPVTLVLPWAGTPGEPTLGEIQVAVLEAARSAGLQTFPDVALVDQPGDLAEFLAGFPVVTPVPAGRGAVDGLVGSNGLRLAAARTRMCAG
jgi:glycosyltransferase involved in cell wall biosynthesis